MGLEIRIHRTGDVLVVQPNGRLTLGSSSNAFRDAVRKLVQQGERRIVLDLADVNYVDSIGLGEMVSAYTSIIREGGDLKFAHLPPRTHELMRITKLSTVFDIFESDGQAITSFTV